MSDIPYLSEARRRPTRQEAALVLAAAAGLVGIALVLLVTWGGPTSKFDGFVYIQSNRPASNSILAYRFAHSRLQLLGDFPTGGRGSVDFGETGALDADGQIAVDQRRRLLFAVNQGSDTVAVFHIRNDGTLVPVSGSPFSARGKAPGSLSVTGSFLVVADKAHDVSRDLGLAPPRYAVFRIDPTGALTPVGQPFEAPLGSSPTQALVLSPRLIVSTEELGPFRVLVLGKDGSLKDGPNSPLGPEASIFRPRYDGARWSLGLAAHPRRRILYANQAATEKLLVYRYDAAGRLTFVRAVSNRFSDLPCWATVSPDGRRLYTANAGNGSVTAFDLSRDPLFPRRLQTLRLKTGGNPWGLALDPRGRTLFVVDPRAVDRAPTGAGNRLHALHVHADGRLTEIATSPIRLPIHHDGSPYGIAVLARG